MAPPSGSGSLVRSAVVSTKGVSSNKSSKTLLRPFGSKRAELERCLGGRLSDYRNHSKRSALPLGSSKNSLRSDSFSCRFACLAYATQESKKIPIIVHPINTSSCGMFFERRLMTLFSETNSQSRLPHFVLHIFSDKSSKTFLDKPSSKADHRTSCFMFFSDKSSKTFLDEPSDKSITALRASCFFGLILENIPHEEVFRGM